MNRTFLTGLGKLWSLQGSQGSSPVRQAVTSAVERRLLPTELRASGAKAPEMQVCEW